MIYNPPPSVPWLFSQKDLTPAKAELESGVLFFKNDLYDLRFGIVLYLLNEVALGLIEEINHKARDDLPE